MKTVQISLNSIGKVKSFVNAITQLISGVGFPIVCCGILFKQNSELQTTLKEISITLQSLSDRIRSIEDKVEGDK